MLVVVAGRRDSAARGLVARWSPHDAALLTADDLSVAGWRYHVGAARSGAAVVDGQVVPAGDVTGVLVRLPGVSAADLPHVHPDDRDYVAAEMTAFLAAWLGRLDCPVVNRPAPGCLAGPAWRHKQWVHIAARSGLAVQPVRRRATLEQGVCSPAAGGPDSTVVTVVGERCLGSADPGLAAQARRLAGAAGVELLAVSFDGPQPGASFIGASLWADVAAPEVADAIGAYLCRPRRC